MTRLPPHRQARLYGIRCTSGLLLAASAFSATAGGMAFADEAQSNPAIPGTSPTSVPPTTSAGGPNVNAIPAPNPAIPRPVAPVASLPQPGSPQAPPSSPLPTVVPTGAPNPSAAVTTPSAPSAGEVARPAAPIPPVSAPVPGVVLNGSPATTASTTEPPFVSLYNGQDLTGWEVHDGKIESWRAEREQLSCIAPGGGWLRTKQRYSDFVLRFEYRLSAGANTGIAFRFPPDGNPSSNGFEVQLIDDSAAKYQGISPVQHTGSLYYLAAPQATGASKVAGDWNLCQVTGRGPRVEIRINGLVVNSVALDDPALNPAGNATRRLADQRPPLGHIGLQSYQTRVDFRKIEIQDLTAATSGGVRFVEITPGAGDPVPPESVVTVHFRGQFTDGRVFIRSRDRGGPVTVALKDVIPGWKEGLVGMKVGGRRKLIVPPELAYGDGGFSTLIPPRATLVYDVELVSFQPPAPTAATVPVSALPVR